MEKEVNSHLSLLKFFIYNLRQHALAYREILLSFRSQISLKEFIRLAIVNHFMHPNLESTMNIRNLFYFSAKICVPQWALCVLFGATAVYLQSCVREDGVRCPDPPETETVNLPQDLKDKIPYKGNDTLVFIRKTIGDTHTFIGQGFKKSYNLVGKGFGDGECPDSKGEALMESIQCTFVSFTFKSPIFIYMGYYKYGESWIQLNFNNKTYERPTTVFTPFAKDSFLIAGRMYHDVATIADDNDPRSQKYFTLFNATHGILKFRFETGEEWELLPKP